MVTPETGGAGQGGANDQQQGGGAQGGDVTVTVESLQAELAKVNGENGDLRIELADKGKQIDDLTTQIEETATAHAGQVDALNRQLASAAEEGKALTGKVDALTQQVSKFNADTQVRRASRSPKPRALGRMKGDPIGAKALLERLKEEPHTIVFSDGKSEIQSLEPVVAYSNAWQLMPTGIVLIQPVTVKADRRTLLAGFALLDAEGDQVAWGELMMPLDLGPGAELKLDRQIVFGAPES